MKKDYISPSVEITELNVEEILLQTSGVLGNVYGDEELEFGGVDYDGILEAEAQRRYYWDEEGLW